MTPLTSHIPKRWEGKGNISLVLLLGKLRPVKAMIFTNAHNEWGQFPCDLKPSYVSSLLKRGGGGR